MNRMDDALAASLQRISDSGHTVTVLSRAESELAQRLERVRVYERAEVMKSLEARDATVGVPR